MCMSDINPFSPDVPYHWKESYFNFHHAFTYPEDFITFVITPIRERKVCLFNKEQAYIAEPHVIPLGHHQPKFGFNLYALGIEIIILAGLIIFAIIARRRAKRIEKSSIKHAWRGGSCLLFFLAILFIGSVVYYSLYRLGLLGRII